MFEAEAGAAPLPALPVSGPWANRDAIKHLPASMEAEQAVLGVLLYDGEAFHHLPDGFAAQVFFEPVHGRIFGKIAAKASAGAMVDAWLLGEAMALDDGLQQLGGMRYLADLLDKAPPTQAMPDLARALLDLHTRRELMRMAGELQQLAMRGVAPDGADATGAQLVAHAEKSLLAMTLNTGGIQLVDAAQAADLVMQHVEKPAERLTMATTGLAPLDLQMGPMLAGDLVIVGGRSGMGKSTLASQIMLNVAGPQIPLLEPGLDQDDLHFMHSQLRQPRAVIALNGEMPVEQTTWRMLAAIAFTMHGAAAPTYNRIRKRTLTQEHLAILREARDVFRQLPLFQAKRTGMKLSQIMSLCRRKAAEFARAGVPLGALMIDHMGLVKGEGYTRGRYDEQTEIAIGTKELAGELGVPLIAMVQLSRQVENRDDKRPSLADLRDSGAWEENADTVLLAYREAYYAIREKEPDAGQVMKWNDWDRRRKSKALDVILGKTRDEEGGTVQLWCDIGRNVIRGKEPAPHPAGLFGATSGVQRP